MKKIIIFQILLIASLYSCSKYDDSATTDVVGSVELVSGDNQTYDFPTQLAEPIVILIKKESGEPFVNFPTDLIHIELLDGSASFTSTSTNSEGKLFINWTVGNTERQTLTISVSNNGIEIENSPITVTAIKRA